MSKIKKVSLKDVEPLGPLRFIRAEWKNAASRCVLIQYTVHGEPRNLGLRLDLDKKVILDRGELEKEAREYHIALTESMVADRTEAIWQIVAKARAKDPAFAPVFE